MSEDIPSIPKVGTILIHSGNIVNWNRLKRKPNQATAEELAECISATLDDYLQKADKNQLQYELALEMPYTKYMEELPQDTERGDLKLTVKIFMCSLLSAENVQDAVNKVLKDLNTPFIESVLLSLPHREENDSPKLEDIKPYWEVLEELESQGKVLSLGISNLDKNTLEDLVEWAKVKPTVNQVKLDSCCTMPADLTEFAKENDIQLLTHNDPDEILPSDKFQELLAERTTSKDGEGWESCWAVRYSVLYKCRGIIKSKGYIVKAFRDLKRRK